MIITIYRGTDQIGGCVTGYEHDGWRLFVDYGEQLPSAPKSGPLEIEGLTKGDLSKSALLITHYHGDHIGCIKDLSDTLPIYMGEVGRNIQLTLSEQLVCVDNYHKDMIERLKKTITFLPGVAFDFGPFNITPINVDHSAFDAYAFRIKANGVCVFHTGDFRTHGFRNSKLKDVMHKYIGKVDYIVSEGTNVSRPSATIESESSLQHQFETSLKDGGGHIVYVSSTNIDRIFSLYHAALNAKVPFFVDGYQKKIMDVVAEGDTLWGKSTLYQYGKFEPIVLQRDKADFNVNNHFLETFSKRGYVLIARCNNKFNTLIDKIPGKKTKYLSLWKGYVDAKNIAFNPDLAKAMGDDYVYLHTSGHCDMESLQNVISLLSPKAIIPIHTDNPEEFVQRFSKELPVVRLHDGEIYELD
ncbi:MAG: hypothetical protein J5735_06400 [Prevotella sp.]|nr:hypothetical protein [Prevotella sp.]